MPKWPFEVVDPSGLTDADWAKTEHQGRCAFHGMMQPGGRDTSQVPLSRRFVTPPHDYLRRHARTALTSGKRKAPGNHALVAGQTDNWTAG